MSEEEKERVKNEDRGKDAVWPKPCKPLEMFAFTLREIGIGCFCAGSDGFLLKYIRTYLSFMCFIYVYM